MGSQKEDVAVAVVEEDNHPKAAVVVDAVEVVVGFLLMAQSCMR